MAKKDTIKARVSLALKEELLLAVKEGSITFVLDEATVLENPDIFYDEHEDRLVFMLYSE